ncbi:MAG: Mrp/NBP35 family ATP-binding protein [Bacteroidota bacterium]|nr:Mrp/NBP35 family ATP-binding protein [Bacteroidota bacterium]
MKDKILKALSNVIDPDLHKDIVSLGMVQDIKIEGKKVSFRFVLTTPACPMKSKFVEDCTKEIHKHVDDSLEVNIKFDSKVEHQKRDSEKKMSKVKNLIAIASGKGGVGKSTVAVNIAISLSKLNAKIGIIDADINGPSIPKMLGVEDERPMVKTIDKKNIMVPIENHGIKIMSIGNLLPPDQPVIWRGPLLSSGLRQLIIDTDWGELDYLIVDLPPGTGDIHITLCQEMPLTAAVVVTTPQHVATGDTARTINMFKQKSINVPVIGVVENMSYFSPKELPDNKYYIFGEGGGQKLANQFNIPLMGQLPLVMGVVDGSDKGLPAVLDDENAILIKEFDSISMKVAQQISILNA